MGQKTEKKTIDGLEFTTTQLPAMKGLALGTRLGRALGPALAKASGLAGTQDVAELAPAIAALFSTLDGAEAQALTKDILISTQVEMEGKLISLNSTEMIDHVFTGRLGALLQALRFALEVNFSDFFTALASVRSDALAAGSKPSESASS